MRTAVLAAGLSLASCRAPHVSCPRFATASATACGCANDGVVLLGACVSPKTADDYCGLDARFTNGSCAFRDAPPPRRACTEGRAVRAVIDGDDVSCVPLDVACPRGTTYGGGTCTPRTRCGAGEIAADGANRTCSTLLSGTPEHYVVDVGAWARATFGHDGGKGSVDLCAPLARRPRAFGVAPHGKDVLTIRIDLAFPNGDVTDVRGTFTGTLVSRALRPLPEAAEGLLGRATNIFLRPLAALGGEASAAAVSLTVACDIALAE
jgi:hypothetical protein